MTRPRDDERPQTHVVEWANLVGDDVPERALRERILGGSTVLFEEDDADGDEWSSGAW